MRFTSWSSAFNVSFVRVIPSMMETVSPCIALLSKTIVPRLFRAPSTTLEIESTDFNIAPVVRSIDWRFVLISSDNFRTSAATTATISAR